MKAYTYSITHIPSGKIYYGVRKSAYFDLGVEYFSSSKLVKRLIVEEGVSNFVFTLRKSFNSYEDARVHETKMLKRLNVPNNPRLFNQAISSPRVCNKDHSSEQDRRKAISASMRKLWQTPEYKSKSPFNKISTEERAIRGRAGSLGRAKKYQSGELKYKPKSPKKYSTVKITRNGVSKIVTRNQVPAYAKCGWVRE
jgi:hypothetical protein